MDQNVPSEYRFIRPQPVDPEALREAQRQLSWLGVNQLPDRGELPPGSRMGYQPHPIFAGREVELKSLAQHLFTQPHRPLVITGPEGVGKTGLAREFVYRYGPYFAGGVFWLRCSQVESMRAEVTLCAGPWLEAVDAQYAQLELDDQVAVVLKAWQSDMPRLLVFDDCQEPRILATWRPPVGGCRVLVTSPIAGWNDQPGIDLFPLQPLTALSVECRVLELGTLDPADRVDAQAQRLLAYAACCVPGQPMPADLLLYILEHANDQPAEQTLARPVLARVSELGWIEWVSGTDVVLPRSLARHIPVDDACQATVEMALTDRIQEYLVVGDSQAVLRWQFQAQSVAAAALARQDERAAHLAFALGTHLHRITDWAAAEWYFRQSLDIFRRTLGGDSPQTARALNAIGVVLLDRGAQLEAKPYFEQALDIQRRVLGADHLDVARSLRSLGTWHEVRDDRPTAQPYFEQALPIYEKTLGAGHLDTIHLLRQLGQLLFQQNQFEPALAYYEKLVANEPEALRTADRPMLERLRRLASGQTDEEEQTPEDQIRAQLYRGDRHPRRGTGNPEEMNIPFWTFMIDTGMNAYGPRRRFWREDKPSEDGPIWTYDRSGMTRTPIPDGRLVCVGGEHEDWYDPDFYIYNDVIVFSPTAGIRIFGYPEDVFPPTDSHTATLVGDAIYLIGGLSYPANRQPGFTPVYRLDWRTFRIEPAPTTGAIPGWIWSHETEYIAKEHCLLISGGKVWVQDGEEYTTIENDRVYRLDLASLVWTVEG